MHYEQFVAVICDSNKKPFRELDSQRQEHGRKCKVFIPFDSEYKIFIKNNSDKRAKVSIDIDGTNVSGNGLIIDGNCADYIERFVDIAKKFLFVKSNNEKVADPTNPENGIVKIRISKEQPYISSLSRYIIPKNDHWNTYPWNDKIWDYPGQISPVYYTSRNIGQTYSVNTMNCSLSQQADTGATVEGDFSKQIFGKTGWNGDDGEPYVFTFYLQGAENNSEREQKLKEYLKLKEELGI